MEASPSPELVTTPSIFFLEVPLMISPTTFLPILLGIFMMDVSFDSFTPPEAELRRPDPLSLFDLWPRTRLTGLSLTRVTLLTEDVTEDDDVEAMLRSHVKTEASHRPEQHSGEPGLHSERSGADGDLETWQRTSSCGGRRRGRGG